MTLDALEELLRNMVLEYGDGACIMIRIIGGKVVVETRVMPSPKETSIASTLVDAVRYWPGREVSQ